MKYVPNLCILIHPPITYPAKRKYGSDKIKIIYHSR
jgi:hypothetical protein